MPDAFFQKKRKRATSDSGRASGSNNRDDRRPRKSGPSASRRPVANGRRKERDVDGDEDDGDFDIDQEDTRHRYEHDVSSDEEREEAETPAQARVRMAKMYLEGLKSGDVDPEDADAALADQENISHRLQKDVSEQSGKLHVFVSGRLAQPSSASKLPLVGGHRGPLTAAVASNNGRWIYTAAKDGRVIRWRMSDGRVSLIVPSASAGSRKGKMVNGGAVMAAEDDESTIADTEMDDGSKEGTQTLSKSSGAGRRKARRQAAIAAGKDKKGKGKAVTNGESHSRAEIVEIGQDEGHHGEVLSLAVSSDGKFLVTGGKDKRVGVWSLSDEAADGSGPSQSSSARWVKALTGHKDSISGLKFKAGSHELYTVSLDRTLKLFDVDQLSYIETLFGHQESIHSLDALKGDFAVTTGGRDRTARWWKVRDESQLVFRGGSKSKMRDIMEGGDLAADVSKKIQGDRGGSIIEGSLDSVAMIDDQHFLTGGDSGAISLWSLTKKKPIFTRAATHGFDVKKSEGDEEDILQPRWITSLACLPYGDVFASGSWDGNIRLWALDSRLRSFKPLFTIKAEGIINSLQLFQPPKSSLVNPVIKPELWRGRGRGGAEGVASSSSEAATQTRITKDAIPPILVAAIGQEPRLGRWIKVKNAKSGGLVVPLTFKAKEARKERVEE